MICCAVGTGVPCGDLRRVRALGTPGRPVGYPFTEGGSRDDSKVPP